MSPLNDSDGTEDGSSGVRGVGSSGWVADGGGQMSGV